MKNVFKRNQIVITALAIMIAAAFYLNYADKIDTSETTKETSAKVEEGEVDVGDISDEDIYQAANAKTGSDQVLDALAPNAKDDIESYDLDLSSDPATDTAKDTATDTSADGTQPTDAATTTTEGETPGEAVLTSATTNVGFIAEAKLSREQVRAKNKEALLEIINNTSIADEQKQTAIDAMIKMTDIAEREAAAETLLESKGFEDVVVSITDDSADVVVNMAEVTDAKRAQIEDIMKRKTGVSAENIVITPISVEQ
ncbi:SpoIIIAH-like family protein [Candidatus Galacturonibacter soehngenii]|uniref:SpoIIIAH-like family protein n=1 Tax=Candidatus Galacturonatibacter soehngenii TaxID=2307010 RepID=A0A7V7UBV2_9FIRM|nr:SpoIIIAH-like family protein [Candidatus Galacturonibacter soehngenii]KAB1438165.1 SpoIIIAH-like family protein [Candidatus Galacturonibacter soehngenii]